MPVVAVELLSEQTLSVMLRVEPVVPVLLQVSLVHLSPEPVAVAVVVAVQALWVELVVPAVAVLAQTKRPRLLLREQQTLVGAVVVVQTLLSTVQTVVLV